MKIFGLSLVILSTMLSLQAAPWWQALGPVQESDFRGGHHDTSTELTAGQQAVLERLDFEEWVDFEDQWVRLRYPKHPEISFRVTKRGEGLKVEGGVVTTVDNSFEQAYVLEVAGVSYGVFLLQPAEWLDDGICFCGPMVHHAYSMRDGCLVRYSLLPGGAVKKAQILGGGLRLMAFEWTHLGCRREVYEKLVDGMALKHAHPWDEKRLRQKTIELYGLSGQAGWLHPGMTESQAMELMGAPAGRDGDLVQWQGVVDDYPCAVHALFRDGRAEKLTGQGIKETGGPVPGTLTWAQTYADQSRAEAAVAPAGSDPFRGDAIDQLLKAPEPPAPVSVAIPTPEAVAEALTTLDSLTDEARWRRWCWAVDSLATTRGHRDPRLLKRVRERSAARACDLAVLEAYDVSDLPAWVASSLEFLASQKPTPSPAKKEALLGVNWAHDDAQALLEWQAKHDADALPQSIRRLMEEDASTWATVVLEHGEHLPPELGTALVTRIVECSNRDQDSRMAERLLDKLPSLKIDNSAAAIKAIESLPTGEPGSDWFLQRREALQALAKTLPDP